MKAPPAYYLQGQARHEGFNAQSSVKRLVEIPRIFVVKSPSARAYFLNKAGQRICGPTNMVVNEIFYNLQGEGLLAGVPSVFIRLAGCPLRCRWCDTKYALDPTAGEDMDVAAIIDEVERWHCKFAVLTGGEPMVNPQLPKLTAALKAHGKHITIETAGLAFIPDIVCDLMSISPKTSNSTPSEAKLAAVHERRRLNIEAIRRLISRYTYQLKFVVESADDLTEIRQVIGQTGNVAPDRVMLMPQANTRDEFLAKAPMVAEMCKQTGFMFCNRLQILLYDGAKGK
jgi:7-carboxy-7-deazaguanine synthase